MYWSLALIFIPILGAVAAARINERRTESLFSISVAALTFIGSVVNMTMVRSGGVYTWGIGSLLRLDSLSALFSLFCAFVWLAAGIYMHSYMAHEKKITPFYTYYLVTLGATQGIFLAGNFIVLLVFFELMSLTSGSWVTYYENQEAEQAGSLYHHLGVAAGIFMGAAIILLYFSGVTLRVGSPAVNVEHGTVFTWAILLLMTAFGIKAGMFPLHIWLPKAHPVAPTPASALLSGILIKTGAYGLVRTGQLVNWGQTDLIPWAGTLLVIIGIITMLLGVCLALLQSNAKRLLAYHSVSQMGYIILGIGAALFLKEQGTFGVAGAVFHSLNHALFKSALFFGAGIVILGTGEADLYKLGGLWKAFPLTFVMMFIAALGITGTPGLNGYISKTLLHHGILEAAATGSSVMVWAERLFVLVGVGTTASFVKLIGLTFFGKQKTAVHFSRRENKALAVAMLMLSLAMLVIGTKPEWALGLLVGPATQSCGAVDLGVLAHVDFFEWPAVRGMIFTLLAGFILFAVGMKTHLFHLQLPAWLSIEGAARAVAGKVRSTFGEGGKQ
ncbi:MAG TPA: NADH dehydrogenase [Firmicutes bacterium]|jgi:hydrogenase-4 component B|nr:complex I subunit 5 family protein [Bacillota bacterium]HHT41793.1 NADH dehydrogenase [Bacillota bacterium]